ncbi:MAG: hypothetical protein HZA95_03785 [Candidatus Vogelbacteria bacterium]|nr:hypothetical protein [Candidatus Vogelbacteria bacterium]
MNDLITGFRCSLLLLVLKEMEELDIPLTPETLRDVWEGWDQMLRPVGRSKVQELLSRCQLSVGEVQMYDSFENHVKEALRRYERMLE